MRVLVGFIGAIVGGPAAFFLGGKPEAFQAFAGKARNEIGRELGLAEVDTFRFAWIVDFPMYEKTDDGKIDFSHNPFSMPQGELEALETMDPLEIKAWQYDIVCNGVELSSGAIRNHRPDIMYKAFEIAGYTREDVDTNFAGMINAFKYGAPPHGGSAPGVDRIVMLLADEPNIREVVVFPMNQKAEDLMMGAPGPVSLKQLREVVLQLTHCLDTQRRAEHIVDAGEIAVRPADGLALGDHVHQVPGERVDAIRVGHPPTVPLGDP